MSTINVAPKEKFEPLTVLPDWFPIDDETVARRIVPEHSAKLSKIIAGDPDIPKYVTWASFVHSPDDVMLALESRTQGTMLGRYALQQVDMGSIFGYYGVFPGEQDDEYGMGGFLEKSSRGQAIAARTLDVAMSVVQRLLHPKHLYLQIAPENTPSVAVAARAGFEPAEMVWDTDLRLSEQRFRLEITDGQTQ